MPSRIIKSGTFVTFFSQEVQSAKIARIEANDSIYIVNLINSNE